MFIYVIGFLVNFSRLKKNFIQIIIDSVLFILCFFLAMYLRLDSMLAFFKVDVWVALLPVIILNAFTNLKLGHYRSVVRYTSFETTNYVSRGALLSAIYLLIVIWSLRFNVFGMAQFFKEVIPFSVPIIFFFLFLFATLGVRLIAKQIFSLTVENKRVAVAVYGAGETGRQLLQSLSGSSEYAAKMLIDDDPNLEGRRIGRLSINKFSVSKTLFESLKIKIILIAMPSLSSTVRKNILTELSNYSIKVKQIPALADLIEGKNALSHFREISINDLLGRESVIPDSNLMSKTVFGKVVLVTGAGGTIGSELCRQIIEQKPEKLILVDLSEHALFLIDQEITNYLNLKNSKMKIISKLCSVNDSKGIQKIFDDYRIQTVFHAAAYKHVPLVEKNVVAAVRNNVFGTNLLIKKSLIANVEIFILISTDKAVRPTNFMGATKRFSELICQDAAMKKSSTLFSIVRFGNVLDSSGSVIPTFRAQIESGGPITVTHTEISRYFMTIVEAVQLVLQAGAMAKGGDVFVLDMGHPIKVIDLAIKMAHLHGLKTYFGDKKLNGEEAIKISITGLRPGEKLYEELLIDNQVASTEHPRIMMAKEPCFDPAKLSNVLDLLLKACDKSNMEEVKQIFAESQIGFTPTGKASNFSR